MSLVPGQVIRLRGLAERGRRGAPLPPADEPAGRLAAIAGVTPGRLDLLPRLAGEAHDTLDLSCGRLAAERARHAGAA